jgi:hypothetical protein
MAVSSNYPKEVSPVLSFALLISYTWLTFLIQIKVGVFSPPINKNKKSYSD